MPGSLRVVDGNELRSGPSSQDVSRTTFLLMSQDVLDNVTESSEMSALFFFVSCKESPGDVLFVPICVGDH